MAIVNKIDSNVTGLRYAEESDTPKTLPGSPVWWPLEPNSYNDFGGNVTTIARNPISNDRQRKKGVIVDLDASGGFNTDLTYNNIQPLLQGFMFADFRAKPEIGGYGSTAIASVSATDDSFNGTTIFGDLEVGDMVHASGFTNASNNGMHVIATQTANKITTGSVLVTETAPTGAKLVKVGLQAGTGELDVVVSGDLPRITSSGVDLTTLGLIPGEWIFVGGDSSTLRFTNAENNGFKRIKAVAAGYIEIDKSSTTMVAEANTTATVQVFIGRLLINETGTNIVRRTYQLERTLGAPDTAQPLEVQSELITGAVPSELVINLATAEKLTIDLSFMAMDHELRSGATGVKAGARPDLVESDAYNTSNDISRVKMTILDAGEANPDALFAYITEATITVTNNVSANKVIGIIGASDMTAGNYAASGSLTAYFVDVAALQAIRDNASVTLDFILAKSNSGIVIDFPLITLGEGRATMEQDQPVTLPLSFEGAKGPYGYTMSLGFFDYLPTLAM
jgi:hypothetical protein